MSDPIIQIENVAKRFGSTIALEETSLDIAANEFFALLGPSGCGKTTLLRILAGFEEPTTGRIVIDGQDMTGIQPNRRPVNMVFQSYAVFPHMSVADNVGYGLRVTGSSSAEIAREVDEALARVGLSDFGARKPDQLSGGQRQRVALARALVKRPRVMLLDEPLSALDAKLREAMQLELASLQIDIGITFVIVTHDQDEALSMADRIAVMSAGRVQQVGSPAAIYESPANRFVADFIGKVNLVPGTVAAGAGGRLDLDTALGRITVPCDEPKSGKVTLAVRPEKIRLGRDRAPEGDLHASGRLVEWAYYGDISNVFVETDAGPRLSVVVTNETRQHVHGLAVGDAVHIAWDAEDTLVLEAG